MNAAVFADVVTVDAVAAATHVSVPHQQTNPDRVCVQNQPNLIVGGEPEAKGRYFIPKTRSKVVSLESDVEKLRGENEEMGKDIVRLKSENEKLGKDIVRMKEEIRKSEELMDEKMKLEISDLRFNTGYSCHHDSHFYFFIICSNQLLKLDLIFLIS